MEAPLEAVAPSRAKTLREDETIEPETALPCDRMFGELHFDNLALRALPVDPIRENYTRKVPNACFSLVDPTPVENPQVVVCSRPALSLIQLNPDQIDFAEYMSGNKIIPGSRPAAHCYCGHQFGYFSGQLGDGATMYLGEVINDAGERWEIQFKGAGKTPYSRSADGRKVLRSSLREFLCSEAMHHLGIPTTRAASVVTSDTMVVRDIFYNGNPIEERATIIMRIAPTFLRFGSFEIFKPTDSITGRAGPSAGNVELLHRLLKYALEAHYPDLWKSHERMEDRYAAFYEEVVLRTARLVAEWQCVGWCHGVLNTDNMSIVGATIDYGPFGFMEFFDPGYICNGSDNGGRYSYENQPEICHWNCEKLAEALDPALPLERSKEILERTYLPEFKRYYSEKMHKKLGLLRKNLPEDEELIDSLLKTMQQTASDWTNTFRHLTVVDVPHSPEDQDNEAEEKALVALMKHTGSIKYLKAQAAPSIPPDKLKMMISLAQQDPRLLALVGIDDPSVLLKELEKFKKSKALESITQSDKDEKDLGLWRDWLRKYRRRLALEGEGETNEGEGRDEHMARLSRERIDAMNSNNPRFILRNYIAEAAIKKAEQGDFSEAKRVLKALEDPYGKRAQDPDIEERNYDQLAPDWALDLCVT